MDKHFPAPGQPDPSAQLQSSFSPGQFASSEPPYPPAGYSEQIGFTAKPLPPITPNADGVPPNRGRRSSRFFIAWLVIAIVLAAGAGSFVTTLVLGHLARSTGQGSASTPTIVAGTGSVTPASTSAVPTLPHGWLYTSQAGALLRFDLQHTQAPLQPLWTVRASSPSLPLIIGNRLFYENEQSPGGYLAAVDVNSGRQLWQNAKYGSGFLVGSGNSLYDAGCDFTTSICQLYGIDAGSGSELWSDPLSGGSAWITLQNGVIYVVSYENYFAVNASNGAILWRKNLLSYIDQNASMTPTVSGNVLSFASCNVTKQSRGAPGCYLYAFDTGTGTERWHMYTTSPIQVPPAIMNGVVYAGAGDGTLFAVDERSGNKLWTANVGPGTVGEVLTSAGSIYVEIIASDGQTVQIEDLNAATHRPIWGQSQNGTGTRLPGQSVQLSASKPAMPHISSSAGPSDNPLVLVNGLIFVHDSPTTISVLNASNGNTIEQYNVQNIYSFTVVTQ